MREFIKNRFLRMVAAATLAVSSGGLIQHLYSSEAQASHYEETMARCGEYVDVRLRFPGTSVTEFKSRYGCVSETSDVPHTGIPNIKVDIFVSGRSGSASVRYDSRRGRISTEDVRRIFFSLLSERKKDYTQGDIGLPYPVIILEKPGSRDVAFYFSSFSSDSSETARRLIRFSHSRNLQIGTLIGFFYSPLEPPQAVKGSLSRILNLFYE